MKNKNFKKAKVAAVILSAGRGVKMGKKIPKQFLKISGKAIFLHTLKIFTDCRFFKEVVIVVNRQWVGKARRMVGGFLKDKRINFVIGGNKRIVSIQAALAFLKDKDVDFVLFHDAVRPFVLKKLVEDVAVAGVKYGAAIAVVKGTDLAADSAGGKIVKTLNPHTAIFAQTPECYNLRLLMKIHDSSSLNTSIQPTNLEMMLDSGRPVKFIKGDERNLKITYLSDIVYASAILGKIRS